MIRFILQSEETEAERVNKLIQKRSGNIGASFTPPTVLPNV